MERPNLFKFATSELSQDAFVCWLLKWADSQYAEVDRGLHDTAKFMLDRFYDLSGQTRPKTYDSVNVERQRFRVDVLVTLNGEFAIVIEDKTWTYPHSGQLERYLAEAGQCFPSDKITAIYLKTRDQSNYDEVKRANFAHFGRQEFLVVLAHGFKAGVTNNIFMDFYEHLKKIDDAVMAFTKSPLAAIWDQDCWTGFYRELQNKLGTGDWGFVNNPSGGFLGFWWHDKDGPYLQLEQDKLCFKIWVEDKAVQASRRDAWTQALLDAAKSAAIPVRRPGRVRSGVSMTAAILECDYRKEKDGTIDIDLTVEFLRKIELLMDEAFGKSQTTAP